MSTGSGTGVEVVTFDFWNTIAFEGPSGLLAPRAERWRSVLADAGHDADLELLLELQGRALTAYQQRWRVNEQYTTVNATSDVLGWLGEAGSAVANADGDLTMRLVRSFHDAGLASDIQLADGLRRCLEALRATGVGLAVVCDVGLTPASALREVLAREGLLDLFHVLVFSEDVGWFKPSPVPFQAALSSLGVEPSRAAHVGDRRATDIAGALALGMVAVRYTGVFDDHGPGPEADLVVAHHDQLLGALGIGPGP